MTVDAPNKTETFEVRRRDEVPRGKREGRGPIGLSLAFLALTANDALFVPLADEQSLRQLSSRLSGRISPIAKKRGWQYRIREDKPANGVWVWWTEKESK